MKKKLLFSAALLLATSVSFAQTGAETVNVVTPGTLSELVLDLESTRIKSLTVTGDINGADIAYLNSGNGKMSSVETLDLSKVRLVPGDEPYATVQIAKSDVGMGKTTATFYISDTYSEETYQESTGLGGLAITKLIKTNDLSGAFAPARPNNAPSSPLKEVILPESLPRVGDYMFTANKNITRVVVPDGVTEIGKSAFASTSALVSVNIPEGVTAICDAAFSRSAIASVKLPSSVNRIGAEAFMETKLTGELDLSNVESLGAWAFYYVKISGTLDIGKLTVIPDNAFTSGNYDNIVFSDNLVSIGEIAFANSKVTDVKLPSSLTEMSASSFSGTPWYNSLTGEDGIIYINEIAVAPARDVKIVDGVLTIKEGTRSLASGSWNIYTGGKYLRDIVTGISLPSTLKAIGNDVFSGFTSLGDITLPENLETVGDRSFSGCNSMWFDNLPASVVNIGEYAFSGCSSLTQITIGENVKHIGQYAFEKCTGISLVKIYAPDLRGSDYPQFGNAGLDRVVIGSNVTYLPADAFINVANLRKVEFEPRDGKTPFAVGRYCFTNCEKAQFVNFPERVDSVAESAFERCAGLPEKLVLNDCLSCPEKS